MAQLLAVGVALLIVALVLGMLLVNRVYRDHLALLRQRAEQVTQLAEQWSDGSISQLNFLASLRLLDRAAAARIQVFSPWGELIFDSRRGSRIDPPISEAMINGALSGRPGSGLGPVQSSLREGDYRLTWVIEPFPLNGRFGAVLLSSTVSDLGGAVKKLFGLITLATVAGLLVSLPIIILVAKRTVRHLMTMHQAALALAEGDFQQRVPVQGRDEVAQLGKAFNRMADHLQSLEELRREWIGNISHELRTPLTSLRGFLQAMKDDIVPPAERHRYLPLALGEVARLTRLTDDLLELARIEGDGLRLAP
ncbi:MAG: HAMP domain-containing protein, partial [Firmicutes bacterium]|nr:HAMP domain-containing protein [Bacillota bacterium]